MGDTPLDATSWPDAGHCLGCLVHDVLEAGHAFLVVSAASGRYVQLHAHRDGGCWVEADSGAYSTRLPTAQHQVLRGLGWPPVADESEPTGNYGVAFGSPVDVYALVLLLVRTLADAYDAAPDGLGYVASACRCEES